MTAPVDRVLRAHHQQTVLTEWTIKDIIGHMVNNRARILVFGHFEDLHVYAEYLRHLGWPVVETATFEAARATVRGGHVDVLLTDVTAAAGVALVQEFKQHRRSKQLPAIMLASFAPDEARARAAGADVVILKPCLPQLLAAVLEDVAPRVVAVSVTARLADVA